MSNALEMNVLVSDSHKLVLLFSPKSNCTVVCKMFFHLTGELEQALSMSSWIHNYRISRQQFLKFDPEKHQDYLKIKFVRCPFERAVSSFIHCASCYPTFCSELSFKQFLKRLYEAYKKKETAFCMEVDYHCEPQHHPFLTKVDEIVKVEQMKERMEEIMNKMKENRIRFRSDFHSDHWQKDKIKGKRPLSFIGESKFCSDLLERNYLDFYDQECIELVESIFYDDLKQGNYSFQEFKDRQEEKP